MPATIAEERLASGQRTARVLLSETEPCASTHVDITVVPVSDSSSSRAGSGVAAVLREAFLPEGFPASVSGDYLSYQLWDSIQGLSSYVRGMLASQAMLTGVGVGSAAATPMSAVFQFFVKDFAGMLGGILFASTQGSGLDCYAKQWRLFADVMNDVGMTLELASPLLPGAFLLLACLGSVARAVTGVAGGATRMALTQHFAQQRNAADIAAKEGSQETAVTLVGMLLGMLCIRAAASWQPLIWAAFWVLTALHVYANVRAMRCLRICSINQARLGVLLHHYLLKGEALTPGRLAAQESLVPPPLQRLLRRLRLGGLASGSALEVAVAPRLASLSKPTQQQAALLVQQAAQQGSSRGYLAAAAAAPGGTAGPDAVVLLRQGAGTADVLEGYCAALMLAWDRQLQQQQQQQQQQQGGKRGGRAASRAPGWPPAAQLTLADVDAWLAGTAADARPRRRSSRGAAGAAGGSAGVEAPSSSIGGGAGSCSSGGSYEGFLAALAAAGWALDRVALLQGQYRLAWGTDLHQE